MAELALAIPFLLILALGIVEVGRALETVHNMSSLAREGANAVSRGATMAQALALTRENQEANGLGTSGRVIVSRIRVEDGIPMVVEQMASSLSGVNSRVGPVGEEAVPYLASGLLPGRSYFVVEMFLPYEPITPFGGFLSGVVPEVLYERSLF